MDLHAVSGKCALFCALLLCGNRFLKGSTKEKRKAKSLENTVFSRLSRTLLSMVEISGIEPLTS